jgi:hypothetical protein
LLSGTNNYKVHYQNHYPLIPLSVKEEKELKLAIQAKGIPAKSFFEKPITNQTHNKTFRILLLEFIIKNNLSFSLINQPETKALFAFLNPNIKHISYQILIGDLKA